MSVSREMAEAFVEGYGRAWESWDFDGFVDLFSDDVVYVEHPVDETVVGREAMGLTSAGSRTKLARSASAWARRLSNVIRS